jgi:hypothetical protein
MMIKRLATTIIFALLPTLVFTNSDNSNWECYSEYDIPYLNSDTYTTQTRELEKAVIRAKIWTIHRSDSLFEMTANAIEDGFQNLINVFKDSGILVTLYDQENIYSDSLYYFASHGRPFELMQSHSVDAFINFFYLPNINYTDATLTGYGQAFNTPGNELFVAGNECKYVGTELVCYDLANTFIPIHELGHCLGLLHTHSTSNQEEHVIREDDVHDLCELNCDSAGDLLCDTEASKSLKNDVFFDGDECSYNLVEMDECGEIFQPQIDNFMSYTHFECGNAFTPEQIDNMFYNIEFNDVIAQTVIAPGDMNDDLELNVLDIILVVNAILSNDAVSDINLWIGDLNNDELLNILDIVQLVNIILN